MYAILIEGIVLSRGHNYEADVSVKSDQDIPLNALDVNLMKVEGDGFDCNVCHEAFSSKSALQRHMKANHPLSKTHCQICDREVLQAFYGEHMKIVHGSSSTVALRIKNENSEGGMDDAGSDTHKDESVDSCEALCKVEMTVNANDKSLEYNFKGVECYHCKQTYSNELNLKKHVYNVHKMKRVKCEVCDKEVNKKSLDRHMKSVHSASTDEKKERKHVPDELKIPCYLCSKKCVSLLSLQAHIKNIHEAQQFKCPHCEYHDVKKGLERHIKKEHTEQVYQCQRCQKVLKSKSTLKEHMWIHTEHRRFICDICGMRFKRTSNYHGHMKSHQEKKYQCQLCGNFFLRKRYLAIHEQTIHDFYGKGMAPVEKGYQCEVCGVKLKWKNNLMAHMRIHTGEKPYKCKICNDDFTCHGSLRTHMAKHAVCTAPPAEGNVFYLEDRNPIVETISRNVAGIIPSRNVAVDAITLSSRSTTGAVTVSSRNSSVTVTLPSRSIVGNVAVTAALPSRSGTGVGNVARTVPSRNTITAPLRSVAAIQEDPEKTIADEGPIFYLDTRDSIISEPSNIVAGTVTVPSRNSSGSVTVPLRDAVPLRTIPDEPEKAIPYGHFIIKS